MTETIETVTIPRVEYEAVLQALEDAEDRETIARHRHEPTLSHENMKRILGGENPVTVWREEARLSLRALASRAGISAGYLSGIENGRKEPSLDVARNLAAALDLGLDDLFGNRTP